MDRGNRTYLIAAALVVLMILCVFTIVTIRREWKGQPGTVGHREPLPGFAYCSATDLRPCILSINANPDGTMVINLLAKGYSEDFYLKIRREEDERSYICKRARRYSTRVTCTGTALPVGETLSFLVISAASNTILAEGTFPIIGMALATPEVYFTPTPVRIDRPPK